MSGKQLFRTNSLQTRTSITKLFCIILSLALLVGCSNTGGSGSGKSGNATDVPYGSLTQGDVVSALYEFDLNMVLPKLDASLLKSSEFESDTADKFYSDAAAWATENNLLPDADSFDGEAPMTKADAAVLLHNYVIANGAVISMDALGYPGFETTPVEARNAIALAIEAGFIMPVDGKYEYPMGYVAKAELDATMLDLAYTHIIPNRATPRPGEVDYTMVSVINASTNTELVLGMSMKDASDALGVHLENRRASHASGCAVSITGNIVESITVYSGSWTIGNNVAIGDSSEKIEAVYGKALSPDYAQTTMPDGTVFSLLSEDDRVYFFDDAGLPSTEAETFSYMVQFHLDIDGKIDSFIVTVSNPYDRTFIFNNPIHEVIFGYATGTGDGTLQLAQAPMGPAICLDINYSGSGEFEISGVTGKLFSHTGNYNGRILLTNQTEGSKFDIKADGEWSVKAVVLFGANSYHNTISGSGDFVNANALYMASQRGYNQVRITHEGDGEYLVQLRAYTNDTIVLSTGTGSAVELVDIPQPANPLFMLEIVTDGHWVLEMTTSE